MIKLKLALLSFLFAPLALATSIASSGVYPGTIFAYGGTTCPAGSVATNGASLLRAGIYSNLYAAIGSAYGTADGTHFNAPDFRGKLVRGVDSGAGNDPDASSRTACNTGGATGDNVGSCQASKIKTHVHQWFDYTATNATVKTYDSTGALRTYTSSTMAGGVNFVLSNNQTSPDFDGYTDDAITEIGSGETRPINVYVLYCIKY